MKYCIRCGQPLADYANFCSRCGFRQTAQEEPAAAPQKAEEPVCSVTDEIPQPTAQENIQEKEAVEQTEETQDTALQPEPGEPGTTEAEAVGVTQPVNMAGAIPVAAPKKNSVKTTMYFIWSIILIFFVVNPIGTPLAIVGAVFASIAHSAEDDEEAEERIHVSKVICIAVTCFNALIILALAAFGIVFLMNQSR